MSERTSNYPDCGPDCGVCECGMALRDDPLRNCTKPSCLFKPHVIPNTLAAGIEAAARALDEPIREAFANATAATPSPTGTSEPARHLTSEEQSDLMGALLKSGTVRESAPPAAPSGWRDIARAPRVYQPVLVAFDKGKSGDNHRAPVIAAWHERGSFWGHWDSGLMLSPQPIAWQPLPAPPGAAPPPPVPAGLPTGAWAEMANRVSPSWGNPGPAIPAQAESGEADWRKCTCHSSEAPVPCQRQYALTHCKLKAAEARCRELEGEVTRLREHALDDQDELKQLRGIDEENAKNLKRADRLTRAAQAAREALEPYAAIRTDGAVYSLDQLVAFHIRSAEALTTLAAVLDGSDSTLAGRASLDRGQGGNG